ncbi:S-layer homology domain-containing protein [Anaerovirgula multivorans]|uniref:S-layer homology domain-containing protein n=1 Tax=Anaerovirgula multivorans TaxID=312168 RepID=A0A239CPN8_9FIRM|nr:S-layer homology domain-containing protein [Anaerovirgula multivorans]SNS21899.1 S-layer homology domain-containing protein [Anaerovirgula multivorans]
MSRQKPFLNRNDDESTNEHGQYKKRLFVDVGTEFEEVEARVVEPYSPPTPIPKVTELRILDGPSHIHHSGMSVYKTSFSLLFNSRQAYAKYMSYAGWTHKFYDERGQIYTGTVEDIKAVSHEANRRYLVEVSLILIKKDSFIKKDRFSYTDIGGHWAEHNIRDMANLGLVSVVSSNGDPVLLFRPNDYMTRAEFTLTLNRTKKLVERLVRE